MADLNETPSSGRVRIAFFGLRNAGKSTLVNAFTGQDIAIVSDTPGTTTDPVSKAMEILPLGPCLVTDTAGLDDEGELGRQRVEKTLRVLETTDIAVWVWGEEPSAPSHALFVERCRARKVVVLEYRRGESVQGLKEKIAAVRLTETVPGLLEGLVTSDDRVVCVCPIDESAPKGRLILPQVQVIRECLDLRSLCLVCQPEELAETLRHAAENAKGVWVITDSQAFAPVRATVDAFKSSVDAECGARVRLTSFSILFARQKGDLAAFARGVEAVRTLKDGDAVLVAEGCTHHRQCNDIGTVKIPRALNKLSGGRRLRFVFSSGGAFPLDSAEGPFALVVHCGGCMLSRREILRRIACAQAAGVPVVNYGILLAAAAGIDMSSLADRA